MTKFRVAIADDHPIILAGLRMLIRAENDMEIVGEATSGPEALELVRSSDPNIAIIDISLPEMNGIVLARVLSKECPSIGIIMLTLHDDRSYIDQALDAGARGYVLKKSTAQCLIHAVRGVLVGGLYIDPVIAGRMFDSPSGKVRPSSVGAPSLTEREAEVLRSVAVGHSTREIAQRLTLSAKSIETYKARGASKLGLRTRHDIVRYASAQGWLGNV